MTSDEKPKNLSGTIRLLNRLVEDREICADYYSPTKPKIYRLPETFVLKELQLKHEYLCSQLYVACELTGKVQWWKVSEEDSDFKIKPDREMIYNGKVIFWEIDRGTEDYKVIREKIARYVALSQSDRDKRFYVCFTTVTQLDRFGKTKRADTKRADSILNLIDEVKRSNQFMVTPHNWAVKYTEDEPFMTFTSPMGISLDDI